MIIEIIFVLVLILIVILNIIFRNVVKNTKELKNSLSGFEVAQKLSEKLTTDEPHIIKKSGKYLDHYNRERNVIKLSPDVFDGENIYAGLTAINVTLEVDSDKKGISMGRKMNAFLVIVSYLVIIIGAFLANSIFIHIGMILFVLAFIIEFILLGSLFGTEESYKHLEKIIKKEKLISSFEEYNKYRIILAIQRLAILPYGFISFFR